MQGANRSERDRIRGARPSARGGQQEGHFNELERDLALPEITHEPQIITAETARRIGQAEIKVEQGLAVGFKRLVHESSFRFAPGKLFPSWACEQRLPTRSRARGKKCLRSGSRQRDG